MTWTISRASVSRLFVCRDDAPVLVLGRPSMHSAGWVVMIGEDPEDNAYCADVLQLMEALRHKLGKVA